MSSDDELETDGVSRTQQINIVRDPAQPCAHCRGRGPEPRESHAVGVQTEADTGSAMVLVPKEQLALMHRYYMAVKKAYFHYGLTDGDSEAVVNRLFDQTPEVLCAINRQGRNPIESALAQGRWTAGARLLELAKRRCPRALSHRTAANEDAMMLAVAGGSEATVRQLLGMGHGTRVCLHYDSRGRNSLHLCGLGTSEAVLQLLLEELASLLSTGEVTPDCVTAALRTSGCDGCTPLHHMAQGNRAGMLRAVWEFAAARLPSLDWDVRQAGPAGERRLTPLAMAAEADAMDACRFLLGNGLAGIDLHEQRDVWMLAMPSLAARELLGQHCRLLQPLGTLPPDHLGRLQEGLRAKRLTEEFLLRMYAHWPDLPQLPIVVAVLTACQNLGGSCRLVAWDILTSMGELELARLMEA